MPLEGVVSNLHVLIEDDPGSSTDGYTFTIQIDTAPGESGEADPVDTTPPIECTIDGDGTTGPWTCSDTMNSDCFDDGDGIVLKVETFGTTPVSNNSMTWTAVFRPGVCAP